MFIYVIFSFESGFEFPSQENDIEGASGGSPEPKRNKIDVNMLWIY